jgi:hypothetical protein
VTVSKDPTPKSKARISRSKNTRPNSQGVVRLSKGGGCAARDFGRTALVRSKPGSKHREAFQILMRMENTRDDRTKWTRSFRPSEGETASRLSRTDLQSMPVDSPEVKPVRLPDVGSSDSPEDIAHANQNEMGWSRRRVRRLFQALWPFQNYRTRERRRARGGLKAGRLFRCRTSGSIGSRIPISLECEAETRPRPYSTRRDGSSTRTRTEEHSQDRNGSAGPGEGSNQPIDFFKP